MSFLNKKACQNDKGFINLEKIKRQKLLLSHLLINLRTDNSHPLEGWRKFKEFLTGWLKESSIK
ncbi:hypothetical protein A1704_10725 [Chryseobacterium cucumeris]|nr:hypothetical protein A1704_10725 [Chryseobacterium cucumeris]